MTHYGTLRLWAALLTLVGVLALIFAGIGTIVWAFEADGFWQTIGVLFIGGPSRSSWRRCRSRCPRRSARWPTSATPFAPARSPARSGHRRVPYCFETLRARGRVFERRLELVPGVRVVDRRECRAESSAHRGERLPDRRHGGTRAR